MEVGCLQGEHRFQLLHPCIPPYKLTNHLYLYSEYTTKVISMHAHGFKKLLSYDEYRVHYKEKMSPMASQLYEKTKVFTLKIRGRTGHL